MNKNELRKRCKEIINKTPPVLFKEWGESVCSTVSRLEEWERADTVFVFVSLENEVDTMPLILDALQSGKRLCVPKITGKGTMDAVEIKNISELKRGSFGIFEPLEGCRRTEKNEIKLAILPCLACDENGNRLGRGGGFYDRFCEKLFCIKIAVCPESLLAKGGEIPTEAHDASVDKIVTEKRIIVPNEKIEF